MEFNAFNSDLDSYERFNNSPRRTSIDEAISASAELAFEDTAIGLLGRRAALNTLKEAGGKILTPEDANARFPNMGVPFREPIKETVAQHLYDRHKERSELEKKIALGPNTLAAKAATFGAGMLSHLMDPLELGANWLIGIGVGAGVAKTALGARIAGAGRVATEAFESLSGNLIGNTLQEAEIANQAGKENIDYDPAEGMKNIVVGSLIGSAFHLGIKEGAFKLKEAIKRWDSLSPDMSTKVMGNAVVDVGTEVRPNPELIVEQVAKETDVNPADFQGKFSYNYVPFGHQSYDGTKFYMPSNEIGIDAHSLHSGDNVFGGIQVTDNPVVANVVATRSFSTSEGVVWQTSLKEGVNALDMSMPAPSSISDEFVKALQKAKVTDADELVQNFPVKDIFDYLKSVVDSGDLPPEVFSSLRGKIEDAGYNALVHDGSVRAGVEHSPHNVIELLDSSLLDRKGYFTPDRGIRRSPDAGAIEQATSHSTDPNNRTDFSNERIEQIDAEMENDPYNVSDFSAEIERTVVDLGEELKGLEEQGLIDPLSVKKFREAVADIERDHKVVKAAATCIGG